MAKLIFTTLSLFVSVLFLNACSCDPPSSVAEAFAQGSFIAYGKVISKKVVTLQESISPRALKNLLPDKSSIFPLDEILELPVVLKIELEVIEQFKGGSLAKVVTIFTSTSGSSCGFKDFAVDEEFIIYGQVNSYFHHFFQLSVKDEMSTEIAGTYWTHQCTLTGKVDVGEIDTLRKLSQED